MENEPSGRAEPYNNYWRAGYFLDLDHGIRKVLPARQSGLICDLQVAL